MNMGEPTMNMNAPDHRILARIKKLLALTTERGATEAEAQSAAAKAAEIMEEYGLEIAQLEAEGGEGEARDKQESASAFGAWYGPLVRTVAESCFVHAEVLEGGDKMWFTLVGRRSAVSSARVLYEYLRAAIWRLSREAKKSGAVDSDRYFRHGCAERVIERLRARHAERVRAQREEAERRQREQAARADHPGAAPATANALVVTLQDYEQRERDLNEDFARGQPPGTTARKRAERAAKNAAKEARLKELTAQGVSWDVAWWMTEMGLSREDAEAREARSREFRAGLLKPETKQQRERRRRDSEQAWHREHKRRAKEQAKRDSPSFRSGRAAGESVSLDQQIGRSRR